MNRTISAVITTLAIACSTSLASAASTGCQKEVHIPAEFNCGGNKDEKFADFVNKCTTKPARIEYVDVECPGRWIQVTNISASNFSQQKTCEAQGLKASNINGRVCASGERRPQVGNDWSKIKYSYGSKGNGNGFVGGNKIETRSRTTGGGGRDGNGNTTTSYTTYCYDTYTSKKNNTKEDRLVAVYCE